jgi:hypothetical protein
MQTQQRQPTMDASDWRRPQFFEPVDPGKQKHTLLHGAPENKTAQEEAIDISFDVRQHDRFCTFQRVRRPFLGHSAI